MLLLIVTRIGDWQQAVEISTAVHDEFECCILRKVKRIMPKSITEDL
jgi:hypothetical protein